jgi:hypothetical protein
LEKPDNFSAMLPVMKKRPVTPYFFNSSRIQWRAGTEFWLMKSSTSNVKKREFKK